MTAGYNLGRPAPLTTVDVITPQLKRIEREQQSIPGWRKALVAAQRLVAELAGVKGASAHRHRIDEVLHDIQSALNGSDMAVLRNSTSTADMALGLAEAEKALPGRAWVFAHGRREDGTPRYGFAVFERWSEIGDGAPLVMVEDADARMCVRLAVEKIKGLGA